MAKIRKGFKMKLYPGMAEEYERRHNLLWQEMKDMIHEHGGSDYSIFLDPETNVLYGYIELEDEALWAKGADTAINRKWWDYMADIMETNPDNSPVCTDLRRVFTLEEEIFRPAWLKVHDDTMNDFRKWVKDAI